VVRVAEQWRALGGAANVAANVVALGASCVLAGIVGDDAAASDVRETLRVAGIADSGVIAEAGRPTTVKTRVLARHYQVARYDEEVEHDLDAGAAARLGGRVRELASSADVIVLEDYNKGVLVKPVIDAALQAGARYGRPVIVDPKARGFFDYAGATVFKPNVSELEAALRAPVHRRDREWMDATRRALACEHLLITLGEAGMALLTAQGEHVQVPAVARAVYDVSGAGDTVTAAIAVALAAGASLTESAVLANHAAGIEVGKPGVATVTPDELRASVREWGARASA
jgi:D-beta-D-heptose 7-phosphate kinase/D-beta-D-heptose 1-phosphate adenosyltransferase